MDNRNLNHVTAGEKNDSSNTFLALFYTPEKKHIKGTEFLSVDSYELKLFSIDS